MKKIIIILLLLLSSIADAQVSGAGRIFQGAAPSSVPSGFTRNRDLWVDTISQQTYVFTGIAWRLSAVQIRPGKDGAPGEPGKDGAQGIQGEPGISTGGGAAVWDVSTWGGLIAALENDNIRCIELRADITAAGKWRIKPNYNRIKIINGNGYRITIPATIDTFIVRTYASLSEANAGIDMQLRINNLEFMGSNRASIAIALQANYGAKLEGCRFYNFKTAYYGAWTMATEINQCFFWENNTSIDLDYARFTGGSNSASQSNHSIISNCKFRHSAGQFAAIKATAVSGLQILHNIFEGVEAGPQYEVFFDDNSSNVVKEVLIYGNHVEQKPSVAAFYIRLKDGYAYCGGIYSQYDCTLITFESSAYAKMIVEAVPYLTTGTKFANTNSAGRWEFINPPATFTATDATRWTTPVPSFLTVNGWDTNGQRKYIQNVLIK